MTVTIDDRLVPRDLRDEADVEAWFRALVDAGLNFHPEESFRQMVDLDTGGACFSAEVADRLDRLMARAYEVCDDPCEVGVRVFQSALGGVSK
jgi:hypothetical protein